MYDSPAAPMFRLTREFQCGSKSEAIETFNRAFRPAL
jgi:hypothetical protein